MEDFQSHVEQAKNDILMGEVDLSNALQQGKALIAMRTILQEMLSHEDLNTFAYEKFLAKSILNTSRVIEQ